MSKFESFKIFKVNFLFKNIFKEEEVSEVIKVREDYKMFVVKSINFILLEALKSLEYCKLVNDFEVFVMSNVFKIPRIETLKSI